MKRLIFFWIGIIISISSLAQNPDICIPDTVADHIIEELIIKDQLAFEVIKQDSIIVVLKIELGNKEQIISIYKTKETEFNNIISNLKKIIDIRNAEIKDLKKQVRKVTFKGIKTAVIETLIILGLLIALVAK